MGVLGFLPGSEHFVDLEQRQLREAFQILGVHEIGFRRPVIMLSGDLLAHGGIEVLQIGLARGSVPRFFATSSTTATGGSARIETDG
jgi:hypothetical protein